MNENREQYREIVRRELLKIEKSCNYSISDGDTGFCPRCGEFGTWDFDTTGFIDAYGNSIYYSTVFNEWRCRICDIRKTR